MSCILAGEPKDLLGAIRQHWGCESDHWIRDVTFQEDRIQVRHSNQAHVLSTLRTLAMRIFRKAGVANMQATLEDLIDSPQRFKQMLFQVGFL